MTHRNASRTLAAASALAAALQMSCDSGTDVGATTDVGAAVLAFDVTSIEMGLLRDTVVVLRNLGGAAAVSITITAEPLHSEIGTAIGGSVGVSPATVTTLGPGDTVAVDLSVAPTSGVAWGEYLTTLMASVDTVSSTSVDVSLRVPSEISNVTITGAGDSLRQGDVIRLQVTVTDTTGAAVSDAVTILETTSATSGFVSSDARFVGYDPGIAKIVATVKDRADTVSVVIVARGGSGNFTSVGDGVVTSRFTSDVWVQGTTAYTGTWATRGATGVANMLYVWDVTTPSLPVRTDSVEVDAVTVNDIKVRSDGTLAVITHEGATDAANGVTLLDLTDPLHPTVIARHVDGLQTGVHNVWIDGDFVYAAADFGTGLVVIDVSDTTNVQSVAGYYAGSSFLHDVYVRNGLAFLSHWNAGLVILDVGNGIAGGSPVNPVEVSRIITSGGQTHNAWYWPAAGYVFVGEEDFSTPGVLHVVDVTDLGDPREVATFRVPGSPPHNLWLDESTGVLYVAWYDQGVWAIDMNGELLGELERQGRAVADLRYAGAGACPSQTGMATCTWAPQLHNGMLYLSDMNTGLRILEPNMNLPAAGAFRRGR